MTTFTFTFDWNSEKDDLMLHFVDTEGNERDIAIFETLGVEGFDDDGICEIFWEFIDWEDGSQPKELNKANLIHAIDEWGLVEKLGLEEFREDSNLLDVLCEILKDEFEAEQC